MGQRRLGLTGNLRLFSLLLLMAASLVAIDARAAWADRIAPDYECDYSTNRAICQQSNKSPHGTSFIEIDLSGDSPGPAYFAAARVYDVVGSGCSSVCKYDVEWVQIVISGTAYTAYDNDSDDPFYYVDRGTFLKSCSGLHTVNAAVKWHVYDGSSHQFGVYRTKNLSMRC